MQSRNHSHGSSSSRARTNFKGVSRSSVEECFPIVASSVCSTTTLAAVSEREEERRPPPDERLFTAERDNSSMEDDELDADTTQPQSSATQPAAYAIGAQCLARLTAADDWRPVQVVGRRRGQQDDSSSCWHYYVHFQQLNRRLDRWCDETQLRPAPTVPSGDAAVSLTANAPFSSLPGGLTISTPSSPPAKAARRQSVTASSPSSSRSNAVSAASTSSPAAERRLTRRDRRLLDDEEDEMEYSDEGELEIEREHAEKTKVRNIQTLYIATPSKQTVNQPAPSHHPGSSSPAAVQLSSSYSVDCWYFSPYPAPYRHMSTLHLCGLCFAYFDSASSLASHFLARCAVYHPPGNEIYREAGDSGGVGGLSLFCVDGAMSALWCQCLCLCAKLFLDHKTAIFDCEQFLFFPLVRWLPGGGFSLLGYFSRSKGSFSGSADSHNVACLLTFPHHQQRGYGRFLIAASYALSRVEGRVGRPERPLSDMGRVSYRRWWTERLVEALAPYASGSSVMAAELSEQTAIQREDVVAALRDLDMVTYQKGQYVCTVNQRRIAEWREQRRQAEAAKAAAGAAGESRCEFQSALLQWVPPVYPKWTTQAVRDRRGRTTAAGIKDADADIEADLGRRANGVHSDRPG